MLAHIHTHKIALLALGTEPPTLQLPSLCIIPKVDSWKVAPTEPTKDTSRQCHVKYSCKVCQKVYENNMNVAVMMSEQQELQKVKIKARQCSIEPV